MLYCTKCHKMLDVGDDCALEHAENILHDIPLNQTIPEKSPVFYYSVEKHGMFRITEFDRNVQVCTDKGRIELANKMGWLSIPHHWPVFIPQDRFKHKYEKQEVEREEGARTD